MMYHISLKVVQPPRALRGTPLVLKSRHLMKTGADPVINVQLVGKPPRLSGLQIKSLLPQGEQNAQHVVNAIILGTAIMSIQIRLPNGGNQMRVATSSWISSVRSDATFQGLIRGQSKTRSRTPIVKQSHTSASEIFED